MSEEIMVSVLCTVYNHEKYLKECIEGFIMQKTDFKYEVLIHDDASTDGSFDIIKEYSARYPDIIKPIFQKENQYSKVKSITLEILLPMANGKYIALCEGDDFWSDENKLQRQYEALESNPEIAMCTHRVQVFDTNAMAKAGTIPMCNMHNDTFKEESFFVLFEKCNNYPFHTSSYFINKNAMIKMEKESPLFMSVFRCGDVPMMMFMAVSGGIMYIDDIMSNYRLGAEYSWHTMMNKSQNNYIRHTKNNIAAFILYDLYTDEKYSKFIEIIIQQEVLYICQVKKEYVELLNRRYKCTLKKLPLNQRFYYKLIGLWQLLTKSVK